MEDMCTSSRTVKNPVVEVLPSLTSIRVHLIKNNSVARECAIWIESMGTHKLGYSPKKKEEKNKQQFQTWKRVSHARFVIIA